jgi:hypothetical protein
MHGNKICELLECSGGEMTSVNVAHAADVSGVADHEFTSNSQLVEWRPDDEL